MPPVLRRSCTWIKCWHSREAQGGLSCRKTQHWLYFCSVQHRRLCSGGKLNMHDRQHCVLSQCKYNSCQFSSLQSSQDGFSQQRTPLTAAWQCYCNRSLHPEWHRLSSLHSGAKTDLEQPPPSSGKAQACPDMLIALNPVLLKTGLRAVQVLSPDSWSGQRQNHAGIRENCAGALQFLVCDCGKVKK